MMLRHCSVLGFLLSAAVLAGAGCGGGVKPVKVQGVVTLDGNVLSGATVTFAPLQQGGRPAGAVTGADGKFWLTTFNTGDGALPGEYKVTVRLEQGDPQGQVRDPAKLEEKDAAAFFARHSPKGKAAAAAARKKAPRSPVPAIYGDPTKTPLQEVVPTRGPVQLELRSTVR
jgi:hypothetical protein